MYKDIILKCLIGLRDNKKIYHIDLVKIMKELDKAMKNYNLCGKNKKPKEKKKDPLGIKQSFVGVEFEDN